MTGRSSSSLLGTGLLIVLAAAVVSGISTFVNTYAVAGTSSDAFVTSRNILVALLLLPTAVVFRPSRSARGGLTRSEWIRLGIVGVFGGAIPFLLFFHGVQLATAQGGAATASFFYRTLFLFASVFAILYLKERFHWRMAAGAALLLGGSYLLLSLTSPVWTDGSAYVIAATVLWAGEYTISKSLLASLSAATVASGRMGIGAGVLAAYLAATSQWGDVLRFDGAQWSWVVISGVLLTGFVALWYTGLARIDLGTASSVLVLGFPVTWLLSISVAGARFTAGQVEGTAAVFAGVLLIVGLGRLLEVGSWVRESLHLRRSSSPASDLRAR